MACKKKRHKTLAGAIKHFERLAKKQCTKQMAVYDCPFCGFMHLTSNTKINYVIISKPKYQVKMENKETGVIVAPKPIPLAERKKNTEGELVKKELALQALCLNVEDKDLATTIATYKKDWNAMQASRKEFTGYVTDLLITPFIAIEQRVEPGKYKPYNDLVARELQVRKDAVAAANKATAKAKEAIDYKQHVSNEFHRVVTEKKIKMLVEIKAAIKMGLPMSEPLLQQTLKEIIAVKPEYTKMAVVHLAPEEKLEIAKSVPAPNYVTILADMIAEGEKLAEAAKANVEADVAGIYETLDAGIEAAIESAKAENIEVAEQNSLVATHAIKDTPKLTAAPVISKGVIVVENTREWAEKIVKAFTSTEGAWLMLKNKIFEKVTIGQMAEALSKCPGKIDGLTYKEVEK